MAMSTVAERKRKLLDLLNDNKVRSIVLFGESGIGKTWTARELSNLARKKLSIDIVLWLFLSRKYDRDALCHSIAHQLSLPSASGDSEVEDDNQETEKEENRGELQQKILEAVAGKKLLLVLDDEGNKVNEEEIMSELNTVLKLDPQNYKVLMTKRNRPTSEDSERSVIEVEPLSKEESLSLLQERAGTGVYEVPGIESLAEGFVKKFKNLPAAIVLMAKAFNYFARQESGMEMLKRSLEEASGNGIYNLMQLLLCGYDLLPNSVLIDCCWSGSHFFRGSRPIHYNELIAYWMVEGYLGHITCMEKAYEMGHQVLMELIDCQILRKVEADYVIMEQPTLNLDDFVIEGGTINLDDCYRGFCGTACLGLANVFGDGKWEGLGRVTQKDGVIKALRSGKKGQQLSTLLLDGNSLSREFPSNFFQSHQELRVLSLFNPTLHSLSPSSSMMHNLSVLVLRGCHFMKIDQVDPPLNFEKLTVLEISGPSSLTMIPDEFFKDMPQLRTINLSALQIDALPSSLYDLSELSWLILRECSHLKTLGSLRKCKKLMVLDLSGATSLDEIKDKNFSQNPELQMLNFSKTKIKSLPLINSLGKLTHLLLSGCVELDRLRAINLVYTLQVLDLSDASAFKEFHDQSLEKIVGLKILDLSGTAIKHLPSNISNPRHLYLQGCTQLETLQCIETLKDLEALDLSKTNVQTLPPLSHLNNLRQLSVTCCLNLEELPDLNPLKKLEVLDLSGCTALNSIQDKTFEQMSRLQRLDLSETKIACLLSLSNLSNLRHLLLKQCTHLKHISQLEYLSKLEELNFCGTISLRSTRADFLEHMSHLQILDLSETLLEELPSMSNLQNLQELYLRGCLGLKRVPDLESLTKLEVLDLSGTAVSYLPSLKDFSNLRQLLLRDCSGLTEFQLLEMLDMLGATVKLPYGISELTHLEHLDLPNMKNTHEPGSSKIKEPNQYGWGISSLPAETVGDNNNPLVSVSSSQFLQLLENPSLRKTSFKQFHLCVHPIEEQDRKGVLSFCRDDYMFRDIYFQTRQFSDFEEQRPLEIRGFHQSPEGIEDVLCDADSVFFIDNAFERCLSDIGASKLKVLKGCWIERCRELESAEEIVQLGSLEVLWVSNSVNLKRIYCDNWQGDTFQNLKRLYLDCCPKLSIVFSSSQLPINLKVLQIKFCDELEVVFEQASPEPELPSLDTLCLWELPKLKSIGCALPSLRTRKVWGCPNLVEFEENVRLARSL